MNVRPRVIPVLTLKGRSLVKTVRFDRPTYLGDPMNALRIFNTKEVDELVILDLTASVEGRSPDLGFVRELASECFMPVAYGGGVRSVDVAAQLFNAGIEKVCANTALLADLPLASRLSTEFGAQAVVASIDVVRGRRGRPVVVRTGLQVKLTKLDPTAWATEVVAAGVGELLLTAVDRDGTSSGYDLELIRSISSAVDVPVIACGGAGSVDDMRSALAAGAAAAAAGRLFVTHGRHLASLVSYPSPAEVEALR